MSGRADYTTNTILVQEDVTNNIGAVSLLGSNVIEETILNAVSIPVGSFQTFILSPTTEDEIWLLISIDKQPWTLRTSNRVYAGTDGGTTAIYPTRESATSTHNSNNPATSLLLGLNVATAWGLTPPATMLEAKAHKMSPYKSNATGRISNEHATDIATVTLKILRVWKKGG